MYMTRVHKILLTGSTGYMGRRLLPHLLDLGVYVICVVRDKRRFDYEDFDLNQLENIDVIEADFCDRLSLNKLPKDIDAAYYFLHGMSSGEKRFDSFEQKLAENFSTYISSTKAQQIIYLGGIANDQSLSVHLASRKRTETILSNSGIPVTVLRAAIIVGSGSASFEIIRDLVEKLPFMIAPRWLNSRCQPISVRNVLEYLVAVLLNAKTYDEIFDIGGKEVLTYRQMLMGYARVRKLRRSIFTVPILTPRLSSLWLYFVTAVTFSLARHLVESLRNDVVVDQNKSISRLIKVKSVSYEESIRRALRIQNHEVVVSSWKDSIYNRSFEDDFMDLTSVPKYGVFTDRRSLRFDRSVEEIWDNVWKIGGQRGWYYGNFLWRFRGFLDKLVGGVGLRRGRRSELDLKKGDALDFWRVVDADYSCRRLLLFAEMKLPGEAWLEFKVSKDQLLQTATFRPRGVWGRLYWFSVLPFHEIMFQGMVSKIVSFKEETSCRKKNG